MRSKAHFRGHPIHPALVHFPIAFLVGAFGFDLIGQLAGSPGLWATGFYLALAGVVTAVVAAVPGFVDYFATVPPQSSAKRRATWHMVLNLAAVGLFLAALGLRGGPEGVPDAAVMVAEGSATVLLAIAGFMGGVLVTRNQVGVDHRYAEAGRWKEATPEPGADGSVVVARVNELAVDQMKLLRIGGRRIVLGRTEDGYTAFDDRCPHRGGSLAGGMMICGQVQCPWHGSQFDVRTGAVVNGPARERIGTYPVVERGGKVILQLDRGGIPQERRSTVPAR